MLIQCALSAFDCCPHAGGRYAGEHKGGLREGIGKLQLANGDKYSGNFHNNLQHGRGVYTWSKGDVYDGSWSDVRMHGVGKVRTQRTTTDSRARGEQVAETRPL